MVASDGAQAVSRVTIISVMAIWHFIFAPFLLLRFYYPVLVFSIVPGATQELEDAQEFLALWRLADLEPAIRFDI